MKISQFAMNKMKAWQGSYGISKYDGIVSPAYFVFDLSEVLGDFFHVTIRSKAYIPFFTRSSDGVRVGQWDLNQTRMKEIPFFVPEPEEQTQIVRFLDWKTSQINKFIRNKRGLIALLKEQKKNIINQAVTRGLDSNVKFKPSGVEWIGDIPEHWEEARAKYFFQEIDCRSQKGTEEMLSVSHLTGITPRSQKKVTMFVAESNVGLKLCQPEDIVINTMWAWMAALGVSRYHGIVSPSYGVYRQLDSTKYDPSYLDYLLRVDGYRTEYTRRSTGVRSSRLRLYPDKFLSIPIVCPPLVEQQKIVLALRRSVWNCLFEQSSNRSTDQVDHGDEEVHISIPPCSGSGCLEESVHTLQAGV